MMEEMLMEWIKFLAPLVGIAALWWRIATAVATKKGISELRAEMHRDDDKLEVHIEGMRTEIKAINDKLDAHTGNPDIHTQQAEKIAFFDVVKNSKISKLIQEDSKNTVASQPDKHNQVTCTGLTVLDKNGKPAIELGVYENRGTVTIMHEGKRPVVLLPSGRYGGLVCVSDKDEVLVSVLGAIKHGGAMGIRDKNG